MSTPLTPASAPIALSTDDLSFFFEDRHRAFADDLRAIAGHLAAGPAEPAAVAKALGARHGLYALLVPEKLGGFPVGKPLDETYLDVRSLCLVREMLGQVSALADSIFAVQGLGSYPLVLAASEEQKRTLLPEVLRGERIGAFALTEPEAGSDIASMRCLATKVDGGYRLSGEKIYISNVGIANHYIVFANASPSEGRRGISAFVVPANSPGLTEEALALSAAHPLGRLVFDDCFVPEAALVGGLGGGFKLALQTLDTFRVTVGAAAIGMGRRALTETIARVRTRHQFGKSLAEQPVVQTKLADMATDLDAARLLVYRAAFEKDQGRPRERLSQVAAMAKLFATEAASRVIDEAVQLHGGSGVLSGSVVEALSREVRPLRIYEGTSEIQRLIIGSSVVREQG
jgi:acyl-CoA dehydrogenase